MSVALDANGFTVVTASADSRIVYVSSSGGNDANSGLTTGLPVATLAKGISLLRTGFPDWMLLKKGDVWTTILGFWDKDGRSITEPMLIGSYGSGSRPWIKGGSASGTLSQGGNGASDIVNYLYIIGIDFYRSARDPNHADFTGSPDTPIIRWLGPSNGCYIEDCNFRFGSNNINFEVFNGPIQNVTLRRNIIADAYSSSGAHSQGLFMSGVAGITLEDNVFDHNGWNTQVVGAQDTIFNHNVYITSDCSNAIVRGNISANASSHGMQLRPGGTVQNNLWLKNAIHLDYGVVNGGSHPTIGGINGDVSGNVFIDDKAINGSVRGWAIEVANTKTGGATRIHDNIISQSSQLSFGAISLTYGNASPADGVGLNDLTVENNIVYKYQRAIDCASGLVQGGTGYTGLNGLIVQNNDLQGNIGAYLVDHPHSNVATQETWTGNKYRKNDNTAVQYRKASFVVMSLAEWQSTFEATALDTLVTYTDPTRTMGTYNATLGGAATLTAFLNGARAQSKDNWVAGYKTQAAIDYIRAGFSLTGGDITVPTAALTDSVQNASDYRFHITYTDDVAMSASSIAVNGNIVVYFQGSPVGNTFISLDNATDGTPRVGWYLVAAPGGSWDAAEAGVYTVSLEQHTGTFIEDTSGNDVVPSVLGTFTVVVPPLPSPPVISVIIVTPGESTANIFWTTDTASNSVVLVGLDTNYSSLSNPNPNPALVTSHAVAVENLVPGATYHFIVSSTDSSLQQTTSVDATFTMQPSQNYSSVLVLHR